MKKKNESLITTGIAFIIIGVVFLLIMWSEIIGIFTGKHNLDTELDKDIPVGSRVTVGVDAAVDWYATMEHKRYGVTTSEEYYCMIWLDDGTFMGIKVREKDRGRLDNIIDATWDYMNYQADSLPSKVTFEGSLRKMDSKEKQYFQDLLSDMGYTSSEMDEVARYYTIDTTSTVGLAIMMLVMVVAFLVIGIICVVLYAKAKKEEKAIPQAQFTGASQMGYDPMGYDSDSPQNGGVPYGYTPPYGDDYNNDQNGNGYNQ